jgi:hypothetical protein
MALAPKALGAALIPLAKVLIIDNFGIYGTKFMGQCRPNCESRFSLEFPYGLVWPFKIVA